jgi:hypothetical protein
MEKEGIRDMNPKTTRRDGLLIVMLALAAMGAAAGDAVSADRAVLVEYFNATW